MELAIQENQLESESHQENILDGLDAYMHQLNNRSNFREKIRKKSSYCCSYKKTHVSLIIKL